MAGLAVLEFFIIVEGRLMKFALAALLALFSAAPAAADPNVDLAVVFAGQPPIIRLSGMAPRERVRVHLFRMYSKWETDDPTRRTGWKAVPQPIHAWADVGADKDGEIDLARTPAVRGTYKGIDPYGLTWSGRKPGDALLDEAAVPTFGFAALRDGQSRVVVTRGNVIVADAPLRSAAPPGLITADVAEGPINGVYAAPDDGGRHPALILLHGSEGGDIADARALAQRFAGRGFAVFALNWFAWDLKNIPGIPNAHVNQPIELLTTVRDWIAKRHEADASRIGVYGHSKGAEYATVAATYLPWIRAVAACVPSDSVWEGYGIGDARNRPEPGRVAPVEYSSWSWQGKPLPYIALPVSDDRSGYFDNTAYYEYRRAADPAAAARARIPVERSSARFLWLGGGRDATWASGVMATRNHALLRAAGASTRTELAVYPRAGHGICGEGTYPTHLWTDSSPDPRRADPDADGKATVDAWRRIVAFFRRSL